MSQQYYILLWHLPVKLLLVDNTHCFADVINISFSSAWQDALMLTCISVQLKLKKLSNSSDLCTISYLTFENEAATLLCQSLCLLQVKGVLCSLQRLGEILYNFKIAETQQEVRHWMHVSSVQPDICVRPSMRPISRVYQLLNVMTDHIVQPDQLYK